MRKNELFTTNYAINWEGWVKLDEAGDGQLRDVYQWGDYKVYTWSPNFYLLVKILDENGEVVYYDYIRTIAQFKWVKKKLKIC